MNSKTLVEPAPEEPIGWGEASPPEGSEATDPIVDPQRGRRWFLTTQWGLLTAAGGTSSPSREEALETLCSSYWAPLYAYVRRDGHSPEDARDLIQGFFALFLERNSFSSLDPASGRFRSFLVASLRNFLADGRDRLRAQKRGGGITPISLDAFQAEELYHLEPADASDPAAALDLCWAVQLLENTRARMRAEYAAEGRVARFALLEQFLPGAQPVQSYAEVARLLDVAPGTVKWEVHRLRGRYREVLRSEIGRASGDMTRVDEEVRYLIATLSQ